MHGFTRAAPCICQGVGGRGGPALSKRTAANPPSHHRRTGRALGFDNKYGGQGVTFFAQNGQPLGTAVVRVGDAAAVVKMGSYAAAA